MRRKKLLIFKAERSMIIINNSFAASTFTGQLRYMSLQQLLSRTLKAAGQNKVAWKSADYIADFLKKEHWKIISSMDEAQGLVLGPGQTLAPPQADMRWGVLSTGPGGYQAAPTAWGER